VVKRRRGGSSYGCLFTLLIIAAIGYFGMRIGGAYWRYYRFRDIMDQQARFAEHFTDQQIRQRLVASVDSLGLPPEASTIGIERTPTHITIWAAYTEFVELPLQVREFDFAPRVDHDF
jgi:hypothetical protein